MSYKKTRSRYRNVMTNDHNTLDQVCGHTSLNAKMDLAKFGVQSKD